MANCFLPQQINATYRSFAYALGFSLASAAQRCINRLTWKSVGVYYSPILSGRTFWHDFDGIALDDSLFFSRMA